jgi:protein-disulfide isomerase
MDDMNQSQASQEAPSQGSGLAVPIAIVIAGAIVGAALYFTAGTTPGPIAAPEQEEVTEENLKALPPITAEDHILGNPDAQIIIVEYSDLECPFCKQFHATMKTIINEYGAKGQVAWVYRNFPLEQLHPNAKTIAEAAECVAELAGNDAYWKFLDELFIAAPINTFIDTSELPMIAGKAGVDEAAFSACHTSGRHRAKIEQEYNDAVATGGRGTPHNIIITKHGKVIALPGSQPYQNIKQVIETILSQGA